MDVVADLWFLAIGAGSGIWKEVGCEILKNRNLARFRIHKLKNTPQGAFFNFQEVLFNCFYKFRKYFRVFHCHLRENFAVDFNLLISQCFYKRAVF